MSVRAIAWAYRQHVGNPLRKAVLVALAHHHHKETGRCFPSEETIAAQTEMSVRSVGAHLGALDKMGRIRRRRVGRRYEYELDLEREIPAGDSGIGSSTPAGDSGVTPAGDSKTPESPASTPESPSKTPAGDSDYREGKGMKGKEGEARARSNDSHFIARPPSDAQLDLIDTLSGQTGLDFDAPATRREASELIDRLKAERDAKAKPKEGWQHLAGCAPPGDDPKQQWRLTPWQDMQFWERDILQQESREARKALAALNPSAPRPLVTDGA